MRCPSLARLLGLLGGMGACAGCSEEGTPLVGVYHPTLIQVSPDEFLGDIPCVAAPGAMQTYVATVFDVEFDENGLPVEDADGGAGNEGGFALPSSGPVSCKNAVAFARVVESHRYRAEIQGYEQGGLVALGADGGGTLGVPILVDPSTGERVEPRWLFSCGDEQPEPAVGFLSRTVRDCRLLSDSSTEPPGPANVRVDLKAALGELACGSSSGTVHHFEVSDGEHLVSALCIETALLADVSPHGRLGFEVRAYEAGNPEPRWASTCTADPVRGLTVAASCSTLSSEGALDIDPALALAALGSDCVTLGMLPAELELSLVNAAGEVVGSPRYVAAESCGRPTRFAGLTTGPALVRGRLLGGGNELGRVSCRGSVAPGTGTTAACALEP